MKGYHFFYSAKQADYFRGCCESRPLNFAIINGKEVPYTCCSEKNEHGTAWDDIRYLGQGDYSRTCGHWQGHNENEITGVRPLRTETPRPTTETYDLFSTQ